MNSKIKALEKIGQNDSLKQHDNLQAMLKSINVKEDTIGDVNLAKKEFVCGLIAE